MIITICRVKKKKTLYLRQSPPNIHVLIYYKVKLSSGKDKFKNRLLCNGTSCYITSINIFTLRNN